MDFFIRIRSTKFRVKDRIVRVRARKGRLKLIQVRIHSSITGMEDSRGRVSSFRVKARKGG